MILVLDLSYRRDSLSRYEFVAPIAGIVRRARVPCTVRHYTEVRDTDLEEAKRIVLCGTALKDNRFASSPEAFLWIRRIRRPILGICAGMQVLSRTFGGTVEPGCEIGMIPIRRIADDPLFDGKETFEGYALHRNAIHLPETFRVLAVSEGGIQAMRHPVLPLYGVMFHPEVRNEWVVERFLTLPLLFPTGGEEE